MQNSNIEVVQPNDGKKETRNYLITCLSVLVISVAALMLTIETTIEEAPALPNSFSHFAIELSNASEELNMLEESDMISEPYSESSLNLPKLNAQSFNQLDDACFALSDTGYTFLIEKHEGSWSAAWAKQDSLSDCHQPMEWNSLTH